MTESQVAKLPISAHEPGGFAHQVGKRPRKEPLFGGALQTIETGSEFGFSRTLDDPEPPTGVAILVLKGILRIPDLREPTSSAMRQT